MISKIASRQKTIFNNWSSPLMWVLCVISALLAGFIAAHVFNVYVYTISIVLIIVVLLYIFAKADIKILSIERILAYMAVISGFLGSAVLTFEVGTFALFPLRILLIALWFAFCIGYLAHCPRELSNVNRIKGFMIFLIVWLMFAIVSVTWAHSTFDAIRNITFLTTGISLIFFHAYYFDNENDLRRLFNIWIGALIALLLIGLWENITGHHLPISGYSKERLLLLHPAVASQVRYRPTGTFNNPNDYATFISICIPFAISLTRYNKRISLKILGVLCVLLGIYLILKAQSRGNLLAVFLELSVMFLFLLKNYRKIGFILFILLFVVVLYLAFPMIASTTITEVQESTSSLMFELPVQGGQGTTRWNLARNSISFFVSTYGLGVGAGNAEYWMEYRPKYYTHGITNPHSWWLELLVNYGVLVFFGYLFFYYNILLYLWKAYKRLEGIMKMICEALLLSLVGFTIASWSSSSVMALAPHWLMISFSLASISRIKKIA
ncbi:MAG: O-antigen ligase family protein [Actinobacteria bacterium]|nr:O-antigen ligase family protein [Actinomycetota bacterium]